MPQLDLAWFLFNFIIAWSLVLLVISALFTQTWKSEVNQEEELSTKPTQSNEWQW